MKQWDELVETEYVRTYTQNTDFMRARYLSYLLLQSLCKKKKRFLACSTNSNSDDDDGDDDDGANDDDDEYDDDDGGGEENNQCHLYNLSTCKTALYTVQLLNVQSNPGRCLLLLPPFCK